MRKRSRVMPRSNINVTPFIDILLVLLVIFMTITPKVQAGLHLLVPQPSPPGKVDSQSDKVIVLSVDHAGVVRINQEIVEVSHLVERLQDIFKTRKDRTMFVQGDNQLLFADIAQLVDAAKGAGADHLGLLTEQIRMK